MRYRGWSDMRWPESIVFPEVTDDPIGEKMRRGVCYEPDLLADIRERVTPGSLAIDIGAHIGTHALWLAAVCGCRVISYEPVPELAAKLRANVEANHLQDRVQIIECALSDFAGHGKMVNPGINSGQSRLVPQDDGAVRVATLDSFGWQDVALMKIDVEHHEMRVLAGGDETVKRCMPLLYVEGNKRKLDEWLLPRGYQRFGVYATTPVFGYERDAR